MRRGSRALALVLSFGGLALAGEGGKGPAPETLADARIVQVLHREARTPERTLIEGSRREALDEVVYALTGEPFLVEAWGRVVGDARLALLALPGAEALAEAVEQRAASARPPAERVRRVSSPHELEEGERVLVLAAPAWREGCATVDPTRLAKAVERAAGAAPRAFVFDLFDTSIEGQPWGADALLAAERARAGALVLEYVLGARARGEIPPTDALFRRHGVERASVFWYRLALPLGGE